MIRVTTATDGIRDFDGVTFELLDDVGALVVLAADGTTVMLLADGAWRTVEVIPDPEVTE